jgi:hypothetical protein
MCFLKSLKKSKKLKHVELKNTKKYLHQVSLKHQALVVSTTKLGRAYDIIASAHISMQTKAGYVSPSGNFSQPVKIQVIFYCCLPRASVARSWQHVRSNVTSC